MDHANHTRYCIVCMSDGEPLYFTPGTIEPEDRIAALRREAKEALEKK
jgi:hypothetical protein